MIPAVAFTLARRIKAAWPLAAVGALSVVWIPALGRGFVADDFDEVPLSWRQLLANPFVNNGRPVETLTFALLPSDASVQHAASLLLYVGCLWAMWHVCRRMELGQWSTLMALSAFLHPSFLWSVTWIAQRSDLLVILFLLLALATVRTPLKLLWVVLGSAAKTPFVVQNLVFALQFARRGAGIAGLISLVPIPLFVFVGYTTYYADVVRHGHIPTIASIGGAWAVPIGMAKVLEGVLYVFAPIPMFTVTPAGPILALLAYTVCWAVVVRSLRGALSEATGWIAAVALALCVPFALASEVRVTGPAAVLGFLAVAAGMHWRPSTQVAIVGVLALNLAGILLNYGTFRSNQFDIDGAPVPIDYSQPVYVYQTWREQLREQILAGLGLSVPVRSVE